MKFETIHSQQVYQGRAFSVRKDQVRLPDGAETGLDIVEHVDAVTILALDSNNDVYDVFNQGREVVFVSEDAKNIYDLDIKHYPSDLDSSERLPGLPNGVFYPQTGVTVGYAHPDNAIDG